MVKGCYYSEEHRYNQSSSDPWPTGPLWWLAPWSGQISRTSVLWTSRGVRLDGSAPHWSPAAHQSSLSACGGSRALGAGFWGWAQSSGSPWRRPCGPEERNRRRSRGGEAVLNQCSAWGTQGPAHCQCSAITASLHTTRWGGQNNLYNITKILQKTL